MKDASSCKTSMRGFVVVTRVQDHSWERHTSRIFFGPLLCLTPTPLFVGVKVVSFLLAETHVVSSVADHTYYLAFLNMGGLIWKKAKGVFTHIFVVVDKFMKWIEVKPAASITVTKVVEFIK
jgi:hypothetical protein